METEIFLGSESPTCIIFWYHMLISTSSIGGTLSVLRYDLDSRTNTTMWSVKASTNSDWKQAKLSYVDKHKHKIIFEAVRGSGICDTAIDDIEFLQSTSCVIKPGEATPPTTTASSTTVATTTTTTTSTTTYRPVNENDCDFEESFCKWTQAKDNFFNWTRAQGIQGMIQNSKIFDFIFKSNLSKISKNFRIF